MKRSLVKISSLAFCLAFVLLLGTDSYPETEAGRVLMVKRKVYLLRDGERMDARARMPLLLKDAVETDVKSRTKLFFTDDSVLNLGELSRVVVEEYLYSPEKRRSRSIYRLIKGSLRVVVGRTELQIHTPTAVAAARGTRFILWTERDSALSCVTVLEGEVSLRNVREEIGGVVSVKEGFKSCVPAGRPPVKASPAGPEEMRRLTLDTVTIGSIPEDRTVLPGRMPGLSAPGPAVETSELMRYQPPVVQVPAAAFGAGQTPVELIIVFPD